MSNNNSKIQTINPATGKVISSYDVMSIDQIERIAQNARNAFEKWKKLEILERSDYIRNLAKILSKNKERYAKMITEEMGKPVTQSIAEIEKCALVCEYYSENAESFLRDELVPTEFRKSFISFEPLGVVAGIMPWNFPFWQVMRYAVPTLIAGNTAILKHSSVCIGSALQIQEAFVESGFPDNVFQCIIGDYKAGETLVQSDNIDAVSVTGSVSTGKRVAELAARGLKKCVLELGGSDPFIVLEDADLNQTAHLAAQSRLLNTGQSCIAAKRFIVVKQAAEKFSKLFVQNVESVVGDPINSKTTVGSLVRKNQLQTLVNQVEDAKSKTAKILTGGKIIAGDGYFYEPTVISNVNHKMLILNEEVFGPAAPLIVVDNEIDAIWEANNSEFGLGASIWTSNFERGLKLAREIRSGVVRVNEMVRSDPRLPFGGIKSSGIGRELSQFGIREFVNVKSIVVKDISHKLLVE
jgi:acyl-CoA reductase-like NAD-dependent aldehyde dehydrogenase